jgi:hypothetical protein
MDFETSVSKLYLLFISVDAAKEKEKKRKKCCCPLVFQSLKSIHYHPTLKITTKTNLLQLETGLNCPCFKYSGTTNSS